MHENGYIQHTLKLYITCLFYVQLIAFYRRIKQQRANTIKTIC